MKRYYRHEFDSVGFVVRISVGVRDMTGQRFSELQAKLRLLSGIAPVPAERLERYVG